MDSIMGFALMLNTTKGASVKVRSNTTEGASVKVRRYPLSNEWLFMPLNAKSTTP